MIPIIQGPTSQHETQIAVLTKTAVEVNGYIKSNGIHLTPVLAKNTAIPHTDYQITTLVFRNLPNAKHWRLIIASNGETIDARNLKALDTNAKTVRFAVTSCSKDKHQALHPTMWQDLLETKADFLLYLGDSVYIDSWRDRILGIKEEKIASRHVEARSVFNLFRQENLIPIYAIWDDHDYGTNNGDHKFKRKEFSLKIFKLFFPQHEVEGFKAGPGISKSLTIGSQSIVMLDNRYFRNTEFDKRESYIGEEQYQWLLNHFQTTGRAMFLAGGSQFFGGYRSFFGESYENDYDDEFKLILEKAKASHKKVIFLSGDIHATELMKIEKELLGYETREFTSSGIIRKDFNEDFWSKNENPRQIHGYSAGPNFGLVSSSIGQDEDWNVLIESKTKGRSNLFSEALVLPKKP